MRSNVGFFVLKCRTNALKRRAPRSIPNVCIFRLTVPEGAVSYTVTVDGCTVSPMPNVCIFRLTVPEGTVSYSDSGWL